MVGERNRREMQQDLGLGAVNNSLNRKGRGLFVLLLMVSLYNNQRHSISESE
jgi:hypothetical protein